MVTSLCGNRTTKGKTTTDRTENSSMSTVPSAANDSGESSRRLDSVPRNVGSIGIVGGTRMPGEAG